MINLYTITVTRVRIGYTASTSWQQIGDGTRSFPLSGPTFWRPTKNWAKSRAEISVARRLRKHDRESMSESYEYND